VSQMLLVGDASFLIRRRSLSLVKVAGYCHNDMDSGICEE
jgi:hypothetical protein